jgi:hypothetical protein
MKLFSKDSSQNKTFFAIPGKGGIDYVVSVRVLTVTSAPSAFYSDSKIKYFPKRNAFICSARCEFNRVSESPFSFLKICELV